MKKLLLLLSIILIALPLFGQYDSTFLDKEEVLMPNIKKIGVFGGPNFKIGIVDRTVGFFTGGEGGVILNNTFIIGGGGYNLASRVDAGSAFNPAMELNMNYGGIILGYINNANSAAHYKVQFLIGSGEANWSSGDSWVLFNNWEDDKNRLGHDSFFIFEPSAGVDLRLTKYFEVDFGVSYLLTAGVGSNLISTGNNNKTIMRTLTNNNLSGISGNIKFKYVLSDLKFIADIFHGIDF